MLKSLKTAIIITLALTGIIYFVGSLYAANTATQIDFLVNGFHDSSGNPLSGGKVYCYSAGTTVGKNVWSDKNKTNVLANGALSPITLDTIGRYGNAYGDGWYKFVVTTSAGAAYKTYDNIYIGNRDGSQYDVSDYADLGAVVTAMASNNTTLLINTEVLVGTNTSIADTTTVVISKAGKFTKSGGNLTINGNLIAHDGVIFNGFGVDDVTLNPLFVKEVNPKWWGFSTSASAAQNASYLYYAASAGIQNIFIPSGNYSANAVTFKESVDVYGVISKDNKTAKETILTYGGTSRAINVTGTISVRLADFQIICTDDAGSGIDVDGNVDNLILERLWIENDGTPNSSQYGIQLNAQGSLDNIDKLVVRDCRIKKCYGGISHVSVTGAGRVKKALIDSNYFDDCTYPYYDAQGQGVSTSIRDNYFRDFDKIGITFGSGTGLYIAGNTFDIGSGSWDTYTGALTTNNPIYCGAASTQITAVGNAFISADTETSARGKLFYHASPSTTASYLFADPYDGIYTDVATRWYGGLLLKQHTDSQTLRIQNNTGSQTNSLLEFQNGSSSAVLSGYDVYGLKYDKPVEVSVVAGSITCNLSSGNFFYYLSGTTTAKEIVFTNPIDPTNKNLQIKFMYQQGSATHTVTWASNIYGTSAVSTGVGGKKDLFTYDWINIGSVTGWYLNSVKLGM